MNDYPFIASSENNCQHRRWREVGQEGHGAGFIICTPVLVPVNCIQFLAMFGKNILIYLKIVRNSVYKIKAVRVSNNLYNGIFNKKTQ